MSAHRTIKGRCLCGAISFTASAAKGEVGACHCGMCQRWSAGPFLAVECEPGSLKIAGEDNVATYRSSDWASRQFCKSCGTPLFWRSQDGHIVVVSAGALDDKSGWKFASQIFIDEKPDYYEFANDTKRMTGPEFIAMMTGAPAAQRDSDNG